MAGEEAAGVVNITNNQSSRSVRNTITEFQEKMDFHVNGFKHIGESQEVCRNPGYASD